MEWLLFVLAVLLLPDEARGLSDAEKGDRRNRYILCAVLFALGVALRIFYTIH
jgi:hypothetical protein